MRTANRRNARILLPAMLLGLAQAAGQPDLGRGSAAVALWLVYMRGFADEQGEWSNIYYRTSTDDGATWSAEGTVASSTVRKHRPTVAVADTGRVVVAWQEDIEEGSVLRYRYSDDSGALWSGSFRLDDPEVFKGAHDPDLAVDNSGVVWAVFGGFDTTTETEGIHSRTTTAADLTTGTWGATMFLQDGSQPSIA